MKQVENIEPIPESIRININLPNRVMYDKINEIIGKLNELIDVVNGEI